MRLFDFKKKDLLVAFAIALVALLAFRDFFGMRLLEFDSLVKILFHTGTGPEQILRIFMQPDGVPVYSAAYRPVSSVVWWFLFLFNGLNFSAFHLFNFVLHALNSVLVFFLARKLIKDKSGFFSFVSAVVFALHPVNLNVVLFVSRMPELLVGFFLLCSLLSLNAFFEGKGKRFYLLSLFLCFAGIFSKESGALIPFVLFFYCLIFLHEKTLRGLLRSSLRLCAPFFSLIALYAALMVFSLGTSVGYINPAQRLRSQIVVSFLNYVFYPVNFLATNFFNEFQRLLIEPFVDPLVLIASIAFAALVLKFFSKKGDKTVLFLFCWLFTFLFAFVAFSFMQVWYIYTPFISFCLLLGAFLSGHAKKFRSCNLSKLFSLLVALLLLSFVSFSPLFVHYGQPLAASEISQSVLSQTRQVANELPPNSTLYLLNYPRFYVSMDNQLWMSIVLFDEASVQIFLDYLLPEKKYKVLLLSESTVFASMDENQFDLSSKDNCVFLIENNARGRARLGPAYMWEQEKKEQTGIMVDLNRNDEAETIQITMPEQLCENALFLFFNGKQIQAINAGAVR
jgi:hypothetical protein